MTTDSRARHLVCISRSWTACRRSQGDQLVFKFKFFNEQPLSEAQYRLITARRCCKVRHVL